MEHSWKESDAKEMRVLKLCATIQRSEENGKPRIKHLTVSGAAAGQTFQFPGSTNKKANRKHNKQADALEIYSQACKTDSGTLWFLSF